MYGFSAGTKKTWPLQRGGRCRKVAVSRGSTVLIIVSCEGWRKKKQIATWKIRVCFSKILAFVFGKIWSVVSI